MARDSHKVELTEALGGVSFVHLTAPSGEKLVIEAHDDLTIQPGTKVGVTLDAENAMFFGADAAGLRLR
jgi:lactose/L-arabinose transport system ATP-binding protein